MSALLSFPPAAEALDDAWVREPARRHASALRLVRDDERAEEPVSPVPQSRQAGLSVQHPTTHRVRASARVRRRRVAAAALAIGLLVLLALPLSALGGRTVAGASGVTRPLVGGTTYTVLPGDSLWGIASRLDPGGDPRPLVTQLAAQVGSDTVVPGERLSLP